MCVAATSFKSCFFFPEKFYSVHLFPVATVFVFESVIVVCEIWNFSALIFKIFTIGLPSFEIFSNFFHVYWLIFTYCSSVLFFPCHNGVFSRSWFFAQNCFVATIWDNVQESFVVRYVRWCEIVLYWWKYTLCSSSIDKSQRIHRKK